jgi:hypothetical protein
VVPRLFTFVCAKLPSHPSNGTRLSHVWVRLYGVRHGASENHLSLFAGIGFVAPT